MKIYVSEKEEDYSALGKEVDGYSILEICNDLPIELVSLEQHEAEIRKLFEDDIERLKEDNKDLQEQADTFYEDYCDAVKCIGIAKKEERQKVIAELLEWAEANEDKCYASGLKEIKSDDLKQKLNQMKEV